MNNTRIPWPDLPDLPELNDGYADEFGLIHPEVYQAAGELWPRANQFSFDQLGDPATGQRLLLKAAAQISRHILSSSEPILNLKSYLWRGFERLVFEERKKTQRQHNADNELESLPDVHSDKIDERILWDEILGQMDSQTRQLFRLRVLGYSYEEISPLLGKRANTLRSQLDKAIKKIRKQFNH